MNQYLNVVGGAHALLGALVVAAGGLGALVPLAMVLYGIYDCLSTLSMVDPEYWHYAFGDLRGMLFLAAIVGVPCVMIVAVGALELFAGFGILRRWPSGRIAGFFAAAASLMLGIPGMVLGIGTVLVLVDADVQREFAR